jgi:hypothetical protein
MLQRNSADAAYPEAPNAEHGAVDCYERQHAWGPDRIASTCPHASSKRQIEAYRNLVSDGIQTASERDKAAAD